MSINTKAAAVFNDSDVAETLSIINGQYVVSSVHTNTFLFTGHYTYQYVFVYWTLYIPIRFCFEED
jgi:hypothetical protein